MTIEGWVKRSGLSRNETLVGNGWQTSYWFGFSSTGKLRFIPHGSGSLVDSASTVPAGLWTHVAVTYDGTTRRYYINGVLDKVVGELKEDKKIAKTGRGLIGELPDKHIDEANEQSDADPDEQSSTGKKE